MHYLRALLRSQGLSLAGLNVIDGWEAAVMLLRLGQGITPGDFYFPSVSADSGDDLASRSRGSYNMQIENLGGKRRRVRAGYVSPEYVHEYADTLVDMGLAVDKRKKR